MDPKALEANQQPPPPPYSESQYGGNYNTAYTGPLGDSSGYSNSMNQSYQTHPPVTVITHQPTHAPTTVVQNIPDYFGLAIFVTICCCWPLGVMALARARESRECVLRSDYPNAVRLSEESRRLSIWGIVLGVVILGVVIGVCVVVIQNNNTYYY